jgi:hypothetical protein
MSEPRNTQEQNTQRCGWVSPFGRHCEKPDQHTGNHRCVGFSASEAEGAFQAQRRVQASA